MLFLVKMIFYFLILYICPILTSLFLLSVHLRFIYRPYYDPFYLHLFLQIMVFCLLHSLHTLPLMLMVMFCLQYMYNMCFLCLKHSLLMHYPLVYFLLLVLLYLSTCPNQLSLYNLFCFLVCFLCP